MIFRRSRRHDDVIGPVSASSGGQAVGVSYGTVQQLYFHGPFHRLRDVTIPLDPLPGDLRLRDPSDPSDAMGMFTGRRWLLDRIDRFIGRCVTRGQGGYLLVESEAGVGKSALAAYLAFTRGWPMHATRLGVVDPEKTRTNLAAQVIARWGLRDAAPGGVLPAGYGTPEFLAGRLSEAARRRDETEPGAPVVLVVDGLDEAPYPGPGQMPFGLPTSLPPGTVVVATSRPDVAVPHGIQAAVERIDVEGELNREDLTAHLHRVTAHDPLIARALAEVGMDRERFCGTLVERSAGVWIYAVSVLDQIRDKHRSPAEVDLLPAGLAGYYADNIARWQVLLGTAWHTAGLPVLATAAVARDAQPAGVLASWAGVTVQEARRLVRGPFKPFLAVRPGGDPDVYTVRHQSLRDLCEGRLPAGTHDNRLRNLAYDLAEATMAAHDRIVVALTPRGRTRFPDWAQASGYARAYLADHAAACGRLDELAGDPEFLLLAGAPNLLRLRRHVTSPDGRAAVCAVELASNSWGPEHEDRLRWLEASACKLRATQLADAARARLRPAWHPAAAAWSSTSHRILTGHTGWVRALVVVPMANGTRLLASASGDSTVRLWNPDTARMVTTLAGHSWGVRALVVVPRASGTSLLASAGDDGTVRLWNPDTAKLVATLTGHKNTVNALAVVPQAGGTSLLASASDDGTVRLWNPDTAKLVATLTGHWDPVRALVVVPMTDGTRLLASAGDDGTVRLWNPDTPKLVATLTSHVWGAQTLVVVPRADGTSLLASASGNDTVRLWDPETTNMIASFKSHTGPAEALTVVPQADGTHLLASPGGHGTVRLWDPRHRWPGRHTHRPHRQGPGDGGGAASRRHASTRLRRS